MTISRPARSDSASARPDVAPKGKSPGTLAPVPDPAGVDRDEASDSGSAAARVMKQTSKTSAEAGDRRRV